MDVKEIMKELGGLPARSLQSDAMMMMTMAMDIHLCSPPKGHGWLTNSSNGNDVPGGK